MAIKQMTFRVVVQVSTIINHLLSPFGLRVSRRLLPRRKTLDLVNNLLEGRTEAYVIDVGAAVGNFTADVLRVVPNARVVCIEPIPKHQDGLKERFSSQSVRVIHSAVGDKDGEIVFHEGMSPDISSVLPMGRHKLDFPSVSAEAENYIVPLRRLDTILSTEKDDKCPIVLLKIDVQGFELSVLEGAERTLTRCQYVLMEVSLLPLYEGQASFEEVVCFMFSHGFHMVDYVEGARSHVTGELLQMDFLYQSQSLVD